jgi:Tfp pilus assembly protein PilN
VFQINLLPEEARPQIGGGLRIRRGVLVALGVLGIALVSLVGTASWQARSIGQLKAEAAELQSETERYGPQIKIVQQLKSKKSDLETRLAAIRQLDRDRSLRIAAMEELSDALPDYVWLTSFAESANIITIEGVAFSSLAVFQFMVDLESMSRYDNARLKNLKRAQVHEEDVQRFTVEVTLVGG